MCGCVDDCIQGRVSRSSRLAEQRGLGARVRVLRAVDMDPSAMGEAMGGEPGRGKCAGVIGSLRKGPGVIASLRKGVAAQAAAAPPEEAVFFSRARGCRELSRALAAHFPMWFS